MQDRSPRLPRHFPVEEGAGPLFSLIVTSLHLWDPARLDGEVLSFTFFQGAVVQGVVLGLPGRTRWGSLAVYLSLIIHLIEAALCMIG